MWLKYYCGKLVFHYINRIGIIVYRYTIIVAIITTFYCGIRYISYKFIDKDNNEFIHKLKQYLHNITSYMILLVIISTNTHNIIYDIHKLQIT